MPTECRPQAFRIGQISRRRVKLAMASAFTLWQECIFFNPGSVTLPSNPRISIAAGPDADHGHARPDRPRSSGSPVDRPRQTQTCRSGR